LQETALVVEGYLQRFRIPIVDRFIRRMLCEWSMVTIPYSCITRHVYIKYMIPKTLAILGWLLLVAMPGYYALLTLSNSANDPSWLMLTGVCTVLGGLLTYLLFRLFQSRQRLDFVRADGSHCSIYFCFSSQKQRLLFTQTLKANRELARGTRPKEPALAESLT
jgi:hypothetical protein